MGIINQTAMPRQQTHRQRNRQSTGRTAEPVLNAQRKQTMCPLSSGTGAAVVPSGRARWRVMALSLALVLAAAGCGRGGDGGAETMAIGTAEPTAVGRVDVPAASAPPAQTPAPAVSAVPVPRAAPAPDRPLPPSPGQSQSGSGQGPGGGDTTGPVGNVGEGSVLPGPGDVPGGLWVEETSPLSPFWSSPVDNAVYDLCDDSEAFAVAEGRFLEPGEEITPEVRAKISRLRYSASCGVVGGDRYVYVDGHFNYPPRSSVQEVLADPKVADSIEAAEYRAKHLPPGISLGYWGMGGSIYHGRVIMEEDNETGQVEVEPSTVSVIGGTVRGLLGNYSNTLFARNVTVTVQEKGAKGGRATGGWPLTVQPGETAPFEVTGWTGSTDPDKLEIQVAADMSPLVDLSRSFKIEALLIWQGRVMLDEDDYRDLVPAQVINAQDQEIPTGKFHALSGDAVSWTPSSHPSVADKLDSQTFDDLRTYVAFLDSDRRVINILELATYKYTFDGPDDLRTLTVGPVTSHDSFEFKFIAETPSIGMWVGNANKPQT